MYRHPRLFIYLFTMSGLVFVGKLIFFSLIFWLNILGNRLYYGFTHTKKKDNWAFRVEHEC